MQSFVGSTYGREDALAMARTPEGQSAFRSFHSEHTEIRFAIPQRIGLFIYTAMQLSGNAMLPVLFEAIEEGSDLSNVSSLFCHWVMTTQTVEPPQDFDRLRELRRNAIVLTQRRINGEDHEDSIRRSGEIGRLLYQRRTNEAMARAASSRPDIDAMLDDARSIAQRQDYPPARWLALCARSAMLNEPAAVAYAAIQAADKHGKHEVAASFKMLARKFQSLLAYSHT